MRPTRKGGLLAAAAATAIAGVAVAPLGAGAVPAPAGPFEGPCATPAADAYGDAGDLFALTADARLVRFDGQGFVKVERSVALTGLPRGVRLVGIDTRPATGQVYGVGTDSRVYVLDPQTGAASAVGTEPFAPAISGQAGVDFNPVADRLRVVTSSGQNLRIDPVLGTAIADTPLSYGDDGPAPRATGAAYTNSAAGATSTTLYDLDPTRDALVVQNPPNDGTLTAVGSLGVDIAAADGFDIAGDRAYAAVRSSAGASQLARIDLATGRVTSRVALPLDVVGLTFSAGPTTTAYATTADGRLLAFDRTRPDVAGTARTVTGLQAGERLVGIDVRPATGALVGIGSTSRIYTLNPVTGAATVLSGPFTPALGAGETAVGVDFNPTVDRIRVVTGSGANLRINPATGAATTDTALSYGSGAVPVAAGAAYTNSEAGATTTVLYDLDAGTDSLVVQSPPNDGTLTTVGALGVDVQPGAGFDISPDGVALAALQPAGSAASGLYCVALGTGRARLAGPIAGGGTVTGLAVAPRGVRLGR